MSDPRHAGWRAIPNSTLKKPTKRVNRVKKTPLAALKRQADLLAGAKCRARGICPACGSTQSLQWCHVISRKYLSIKWREDNCMSLCSACHTRFTYNPDVWIAWLMHNYTVPYLNLYEIRNTRVKVDRSFMEQTIQSLQTRHTAP